MLKGSEALQEILSRVRTVETERVPLDRVYRRVLREDVSAAVDLPPFDNSAVDGFAVVAKDTQGASKERPVTLTIGEGQARVVLGTAVKTMTGCPIPPGADAMVMVEDTQETQDGRVQVFLPAREGDHVRRRGEDVRAGTVVLRAGDYLGPAQVAMLAAAGRSEALVSRQLRVALITTGDEVAEAGQPLAPNQIWNSNRYSLAGLIASAGVLVSRMLHALDEPEAVAEALNACSSDDAVVTCGAVSMGERDFIRSVLESEGSVVFWKVNTKPGKPLLFAVRGSQPVFGLPGNQVSCVVDFEYFVRPALRAMLGRRDVGPHLVPVLVGHTLRTKPGRLEFVRARLEHTEQGLVAHPVGPHGSGILSSLTAADCLLVVREEAEEVAAGTQVPALLLREEWLA